MKKFMLALMLMISGPVMAHHHGHGFRHHHWHGGVNNNWVAPAIIGGVVTYVLTRPAPQPVVIEQQPIILQQQTVCSSWKELQQQDGTILRERTCYQR